MAKFLSKKQNRRGFTLVELLVAVLMFSLIVVAISGLFISGIRSQKYSLLSQRLLDQTSYAMEFMSRALRMARKELIAGQCLSTRGTNYEVSPDGLSLKFINHLEGDDCQRFFLDNSQLKFQRNITGTPETLELTSSQFEVTDLKFIVIGGDQYDDLQPRVNILMEIRWKSLRPEEARKVRIQSSVSQRNLDIVY